MSNIGIHRETGSRGRIWLIWLVELLLMLSITVFSSLFSAHPVVFLSPGIPILQDITVAHAFYRDSSERLDAAINLSMNLNVHFGRLLSNKNPPTYSGSQDTAKRRVAEFWAVLAREE